MEFTRRVLGIIGWLRQRKIIVIGLIVVLEILIGLTDYLVSDKIPITALHYLTIALATVILGWPGALALSVEATFSFYLSSYVTQGQPLINLALPSLVLTLLVFVVVSAGVVLILHLLNSLQVANEVLSERLRQLQASRAQVELLTGERERVRLARELHDGVAKTLSGIEYSAAALARLVPVSNTQALDKIRFIEKVCHDEARQLREVILDLRQGYKTPLFELLQTYLERWQVAYNIEVITRLTGPDADLSPTVVYELMAIIEETLENAQRHSQASNIWLTIRLGDRLEMEISDDGQGLDEKTLAYYQPPDTGPQIGPQLVEPLRSEDGRPHFGLAGMIERAEWLGGSLTLGRAAQGGLSLELQMPLKLDDPTAQARLEA